MVLLLFSLAGCGGRKTYHVVQPGETLSRIGQAYGVPYEKIARANRIADPSRIEIGQRLLIPDAKKKGKVVLNPANARLSPMEYSPGQVTIFGRVVSIMRRL